jgi:cell volume regulation protein A
MEVITLLVIIAAILILGVFGEFFFSKTMIPEVLWLILTGIFVGPFLGLVVFDAASLMIQFFAALALIVVMFEGGLHLKIFDVIKNSYKSALLGVGGFFASMITITSILLVCDFTGYLKISLINAMILGSILGGTSSLIVIPLIRKAGVSSKVEGILSVESALTDALSVVLSLALIQIAVSSSANMQVVASQIAAQFAVGIVFGFIIGIIWLYTMKSNYIMQMQNKSYTLTFGVLLMLYSFTSFVGGSAAISCLVFGIVLGNTKQVSQMLKLKTNISLDGKVGEFNSLIAFFIKTIFFALIGMFIILEPQFLLLGLIIAIILIFPRKLIADFVFKKDNLSKKERPLVWGMIPRGLAAATLATIPMTMGLPGAEVFQNIVFSTILFTIVVTTVIFYRSLKG